MHRARQGGQEDGSAQEEVSLYGGRDGKALRLVPSVVLYVDVLGVRQMARRRPATNLRRFGKAISRSYRDFGFKKSPWPSASFSDMLVLCSPLSPENDEKSAISGLVFQAAYLQSALSESGFFLRGGLTLGKFHISDEVIFGPALVDAVEIEEKVAVSPRIVLSKHADSIMKGSGDGLATDSSAHSLLLRDGDGHAFVNHLALLFDDPSDPLPALESHRAIVMKCLDDHRKEKRHWEKYRWAAEYHNSVVASAMPDATQLLVPQDTMTWQFDPFA